MDEPAPPPTELARLIAEADGAPRPVDDFARVNPRASTLGTALAPYRYVVAALGLARLSRRSSTS